jgi:GT2 family glycosyltransferase
MINPTDRVLVDIQPAREEPVLVGIPTLNGAERLGWLLESIRLAGDSTHHSVLVLDDGSRPDEREKIRQVVDAYAAAATPSSGIGLLRHESNLGITKAWNDLARAYPAEYVVLLNDDILVSPSWLHNLVFFLRENPGAGSAFLNTYFFDPGDAPAILQALRDCDPWRVTPRHPVSRELQPEQRRSGNPDETPGVCMCPIGCSFGFRRSLFDEIGGFDERFIQTHQESSFGTSCAERGLPAYGVPWPPVWHMWSQTFKENKGARNKAHGDHGAYIDKWGGDFQGDNGTHPRFMSGMGTRVVKWVNINGELREAEVTIQ